MQVNAEAGLKVLIHHHRRFRIHDGRTSQTAANRFKNLLRLNAAHLTHLHCFRQHCDVDRHDGLVAQHHRGEEAQQDHRREAPDALGGPLQNALRLRERARAL